MRVQIEFNGTRPDIWCNGEIEEPSEPPTPVGNCVANATGCFDDVNYSLLNYCEGGSIFISFECNSANYCSGYADTCAGKGCNNNGCLQGCFDSDNISYSTFGNCSDDFNGTLDDYCWNANTVIDYACNAAGYCGFNSLACHSHTSGIDMRQPYFCMKS